MAFEELGLLRKMAQIKNTTLSIRLTQMNKSTAFELVDKQLKSRDSDVSHSKGTQQMSAVDDRLTMNEFFSTFRTEEDKMFNIKMNIVI